MLITERGQGESVPRVSVSDTILIEKVDDGGLVFDINSGATTLINHVALKFLTTLRQLGKVDLQEIALAVGGVETDDILASLEKSQLVHRC
jgi:hypothetical protein